MIAAQTNRGYVIIIGGERRKGKEIEERPEGVRREGSREEENRS